MNQQELASRLTLNCMNSYVQPQNLSELSVTIIDVRNVLYFLNLKCKPFACYFNVYNVSFVYM